MRRLVLAAELSLDGYLAHGPDSGWARDHDDPYLAAYHRRIVLKAGVHAVEGAWTADAVAELLDEGGDTELAPVVVQGGALFCQALIEGGLVDEYRLTVHPVVLGEGDRLFTIADRLLNLSTRYFAKGSVAYVLVPESKYRDRPPPYPWSAGTQGTGQHEHDPEPEDPAERPPPG